VQTRLASLVLAVAGALALATPRDVSACGGFFARRATKTVPSLQVEQVLIVHDPKAEQEHFIRELVFRDAKEPFGFVVPTPSRPTVAKVERSPFVDLALHYPPEPRGLSLGGGGGGAARSAGGLAGVAPVTVLSQQRIGSFTAFVLAATDSGALRSWLDKNQLATTPESDAWLEHYVSLGFYYVAFRYEVPAAKAGEDKTKSETVRISFASPLPFYPYKEPDHGSADAGWAGPRVLAVWLMTPERFVPVAAQTVGERVSWKRPWAEPRKHEPVKRDALRAQLGAELGALVPAPRAGEVDPWTVQTFEDQKTSRRGWGDVVLVPETAREADVSKLARFGGLAASLDPKGEKP
jgi:hypothetical protein